jgi:predicted GIY-YIG superfamily endonuclease
MLYFFKRKNTTMSMSTGYPLNLAETCWRLGLRTPEDIEKLVRVPRVPVRPEPVDLRKIAGTLPQWKPKNQGGFDPQSVSVQLYPSVYVLQLEDGCYYVGLSTAGTGVEQRLTRHLMNIGANWVQQHKAIAVVDFYYPATKETENAVTIYYATLYGRDKVRGGSWTRPEQRPPVQQ